FNFQHSKPHPSLSYWLNYLIKSFMADRKFLVAINGTYSDRRNIPAGVPQGSVLSPLLYSIFISDFKKPNAPLIFNDEEIEIRKSVTYLGMKVDSKITFGPHMKKVSEKATRCIRSLYALLPWNS